MRLLFLVPLLFLLACGSSDEPEATAVVLQTEGNPTSTPYPAMECIGGDVVTVGNSLQCRPYTPPPQIIVVTPTPGPITPTPETVPESPVHPPRVVDPTPTLPPTPEPTPVPPPTPTATPAAPPTPPGPTPKPTSPYRAVGVPEEVGFDGFVFTGGPQANSLDITFSASIETNRYTEITEIQVWQTLRRDDSGECSTERPIAFITKPRGGGQIYIPSSTTYSWSYCTSAGQKPIMYSQKIPWLAAESWSYSERSRSKTYDPFITDSTIHINLRDDRVDDLRYSSSEGYILLIFSGNELLSRTWVDDR